MAFSARTAPASRPRADADDAVAAHGGHGDRGGVPTCLREGPQVRASIGAALQEAALDAFLTGREHMDLQGGLQGMSVAERTGARHGTARPCGPRRSAADRKVGGYSGGMKCRLDLALATGHRPALHALLGRTHHRAGPAEPQPAVGRGGSRWRTRTAVTVFLTTQYLEEADRAR